MYKNKQLGLYWCNKQYCESPSLLLLAYAAFFHSHISNSYSTCLNLQILLPLVYLHDALKSGQSACLFVPACIPQKILGRSGDLYHHSTAC